MSKQQKVSCGARKAMVDTLEPRLFLSAAHQTSAEQLVASANNAFAFDLLHQLAPDSSGNTFFSPYSADTALEMALEGAKGVTASEMIKALRLPRAALADAGIAALNQLFQATSAANGYELSSANRLWVNAHLTLLNSFLRSSQNTFGAAPQSVDFSNPAAAANTINTWVSNQTHGKITNLIPADALSALTALVITNAVYFKANWASPFDPSLTQAMPFHVSPTQTATAKMMEQTSELGYYAQPGANGFQAVDLPYQGNFDMMVILPNTSDAASFQPTLTSNLFSKIAAHLSATYVDVHLPQFTLNETYGLNQPLEKLGIRQAFSNQADFGGISHGGGIKITAVIQKSFINVNETGTEAAAATGVVATDTAVVIHPTPVQFDANHRFYFAIRERNTNAILFLGNISNPGAVSADNTSLSQPSQPVVSPAKRNVVYVF